MSPRLALVTGSQPQPGFVVPGGLDPLLTLALGLRAGYQEKPPLPVGHQNASVTERLPTDHVLYALAGKTSSDLGGPDGLTTAWDQTLADLVTIARPWPLARPIAVIGSSAEDFALAVALDRMLGGTIWFPAEWAHDPALKWPLQIACYDLLNTARSA